MSDETSVIRMIGRYQVLEELGRGAMGVVYRGFDPIIRRTVALKTIAFVADDADARTLRERLYREAAAAGTLTHPSIVTIYDIIDDGATTAVAMELVEGQPLTSRIAPGQPLPIDETIGIFEQICSALDYAGSKSIVHRDIKPANILLTPDGRAKILDFGIARVAVSGVTQTSTIMGSPSYMSPEQVRGLALDPRSDLFSAAVVLYEMLTGQRPFGGDDVATTMYRIVHEQPKAVEQVNPAISPSVSNVLYWALAKNPADRFQSGRELVEALKQAVSGATVKGPAALEPATPPIGTAGETPVHATVETPAYAAVESADEAAVEARVAKRSALLVYGAIASGVMLVAIVLVLVLGGGAGTISGGSPSVGGGGPGVAVPPSALPTTAAAEPAPLPLQASNPPASAEMPGAKGPGDERATPTTAAPLAAAKPSPARAAAGAGPIAGREPKPVPPPPAASAEMPGTGRAAIAVDQPAARPAPSPSSGAAAPTTTTPATMAATHTTPPAGAAVVSTTPPAAAATVPTPPPPTPASGDAVLRVGFDERPYPVTLLAGDVRLGRVETADGTVNVEAGTIKLRAVNEAMYLNADLGTVTLKPGERRSISMPGTASAVFSVKGDDYAGVRILIDSRQVPGPYPAQIARIAAGNHYVVYRWISGPAAGREITDTITIGAGGHFIIRAALDNAQIVVQQLR